MGLELEKPVFLKDKTRRKFFGTVLTVFLASGFFFAGIINISGLARGNSCTVALCECEEWIVDEGDTPEETTVEDIKPYTGEKDCNYCSGQRFIYHIGVFWISQDENSRQVIQCEEGEKTGEYYRTDSLGEIKTGNILESDFPVSRLPAAIYNSYFE